jgi:myo-inositol-1(or 4)-monophosphatase
MNLIALSKTIMPAIGRIGHEILLKSGDVQGLQATEKAAGDVVTQMDTWAEQALKTVLLVALPGSEFMGEETGGALSAAPTWIVDPIDGTANFARGYPQWSMVVALAVQGKPVLGVVFDPSRDELFYATEGQGAWLKSARGLQRLQCAQVSEPLKATVSTVFPKPRSPLMEPYLKELTQVLPHVGQVRRSGSMALELAYVAAGRADGFWERGMSAWDIAAASVLLQESGAKVIALDELALLDSQFLAAGSPLFLPQLRRLLMG